MSDPMLTESLDRDTTTLRVDQPLGLVAGNYINVGTGWLQERMLVVAVDPTGTILSVERQRQKAHPHTATASVLSD